MRQGTQLRTRGVNLCARESISRRLHRLVCSLPIILLLHVLSISQVLPEYITVNVTIHGTVGQYRDRNRNFSLKYFAQVQYY